MTASPDPALKLPHGSICVALAGDTMFDQAAIEAVTTPFLEFRLDSLPEPMKAVPLLETFLKQRPELHAIATCRRAACGGAFAGTAQQQMDVLLASAKAGCGYIDVEVETAEELGTTIFKPLHAAGARVLLSWHDFERTPPLEPVYERMAAFAPDILKIVPTANTLADGLRLLDLLEHHGERRNLVAMSMGMPGFLTRVLGPRFGSLWTFASATGSAGTAPGQVDAATLRNLYRVDRITAATALYAVAGKPVSGSRSPRMHNTAFQAAGLDAVLLPLEPDSTDDLRRAMERLALRGLCITMPLKQAVLPMLTAPDPAVLSMGACNTLRVEDGGLAGFNTDVSGIVEPLALRCNLRGARVLLLGAGGAARAAVYGLKQAGAEVSILNRTESSAAALAAEFGVRFQPRSSVTAEQFDIVVNATPCGMGGNGMALPVAPGDLHARLLFDLIYYPLDTPMIQAAQRAGMQTVSGLEMFVRQGAAQFELWTGQTAPIEAMERAVLETLR